VVWMEHGQVRMHGPPEEVIDAYVESVEGPPRVQDAEDPPALAAA
jgi:ABC-type polysaccharide/polyol phosphate transport system ATPase subunit